MSERAKVTSKTPEPKRDNSASQKKQMDFFQQNNSPIDQILFLQRTVGNQAVQGLLKSSVIQAKLTMGQSGDIYEQEADRVAGEVMRMPDPSGAGRKGVSEYDKVPSIQRMCTDCEEELQRQPQNSDLGYLKLGNSSEEQLHRKTGGIQVQRMCSECEEAFSDSVGAASSRDKSRQACPELSRRDGAPTLLPEANDHPNLILQRQPMEEEEELLQTKEISGETPEVTPSVETQVNRIRGGGQPLPESVRGFFEPRFGQDFSGVRVHTDTKASESAQAVNAKAYTLGHDVVFSETQYSPGTESGKKLIAHELTHVVQQGMGAKAGVQRQEAESAEGAQTTLFEPLPFTPAEEIEEEAPQAIPEIGQKPDRSDTSKVTGLWLYHNRTISGETKKLHPDREFEYEDSIFFDFDSAVLPEVERTLKIDRANPDGPRGGWLGRADKKKLSLTLKGNASEEGNAAYNKKLSGRRIDAVGSSLSHTNITIKKENIFGKDKTIDFRRARRVDIFEAGVAGPQATPGECSEVLPRASDTKSKAISLLDKAALDILLAVRSPRDPDSVKTRRIVAKWFASSNNTTMSRVAEGLTKISDVLGILDQDKGNLTCETTGKEPVVHCSEGVGARGDNDPPQVIVCSKMQHAPDLHFLHMLLHEGGHSAGFMKDFAYAYERIFEFIKPENRFDMPDGYVGVTLELNKELRKADVETPEIGKKDEVKCEGSQETLAKKSVALVERWLKDSLTSVRELYDKSNADFMPSHIATVKTHFDPDFTPENTKVLSALFARYQELKFPFGDKLKINCVSELKSLSPLGGFWSESSSGLPGDSLFLLSEFFKLAQDADQAALLVAEMLATASGFIEPRHRKSFALMAQSFNKTQNRLPWRKED